MNLNFQKISIISSIVILIVFMALIGVSFYNINKKRNFPPTIASCPDYFETTPEGKCKLISNLDSKIGSCADIEYDFSSYTLKDKYNEAKRCKWEWDGITNNGSLE